jgi:hypothetical protein
MLWSAITKGMRSRVTVFVAIAIAATALVFTQETWFYSNPIFVEVK